MFTKQRLEYLLQNVGDMAFKRRVKTIINSMEIQSTDKILDCGCGEGFYLKVIRDFSDCKLYGFDGGNEVLSRAKVELSGCGVQIDKGDIYNLPYQDAEFDKIILSEVLEHLPDDFSALIEIKRVLKPGGVLFITVPNHNYPFMWDPINKTIETLFRTHIKSGFWAGIWNMHTRLYTSDEIISLIKNAGLEIVSVEAMTHYCIPFNHLFLNGMKRLLNKGMLPGISTAADKFRFKENNGSRLNPVNMGYRFLNIIDRLNEKIHLEESSVSIGIKTVKPR